MARFQARPREDGLGPYRWAHVVKTPQGFAQGTIYHQSCNALSEADVRELRALCDREGFELRRAS